MNHRLIIHGLTEMVTPSEISAVLSSNDSLCLQADRLYALAMDRGGKDNITLVLITISAD